MLNRDGFGEGQTSWFLEDALDLNQNPHQQNRVFSYLDVFSVSLQIKLAFNGSKCNCEHHKEFFYTHACHYRKNVGKSLVRASTLRVDRLCMVTARMRAVMRKERFVSDARTHSFDSYIIHSFRIPIDRQPTCLA